jgi:hypothetical protein
MLPEWEADLTEALAELQALDAAGSSLLLDASALSDHFYNHWFHTLAADTFQQYPSPGQFAAATALAHLFHPGWTLKALELNGIRAENLTATEALLAMGDVAPAEPSKSLRPGVALRVLDRTTQNSNGFWHLWSAGWRVQAPELIERLYLSIAPDAELIIAKVLVENAPVEGIWYAKFLTGLHPTGRRDPALLYLPSGYCTMPWVESFLTAAAPYLLPSRIRLTTTYAPGVSFAYDPGSERSFGQMICDALAAAAQPDALASLPSFLAAFQSHVPTGGLTQFVEPAA